MYWYEILQLVFLPNNVTWVTYFFQLLICTGHGEEGRIPQLPNYCAHQTTILVMAMGRLEAIVRELKYKGYPMDLPIAIVQNATMPTERQVTGRLKSMIQLVQQHKLRPPATIVLGKVVTALHTNTNNSIKRIGTPLIRIYRPKTSFWAIWWMSFYVLLLISILIRK